MPERCVMCLASFVVFLVGCAPNNEKLLKTDVQLRVQKAHRDYMHETVLQSQLRPQPDLELISARYDGKGWLTLTFSWPVSIVDKYRSASPLELFALRKKGRAVRSPDYFEDLSMSGDLGITIPTTHVNLPVRLKKGKKIDDLTIVPVRWAFECVLRPHVSGEVGIQLDKRD